MAVLVGAIRWCAPCRDVAASAHNLDSDFLRLNRYTLAFRERDSSTMREQVDWAKGKPGYEDRFDSADFEERSAVYRSPICRRGRHCRRPVHRRRHQRRAARFDEADLAQDVSALLRDLPLRQARADLCTACLPIVQQSFYCDTWESIARTKITKQSCSMNFSAFRNLFLCRAGLAVGLTSTRAMRFT